MSSPESSIHHEQIQDLLGVYALDALDADERDQVEEHLKVCPRCRDEVAKHHEVAGLIANNGSEAPPQIWDKISAKLGSAQAPEWGKIAMRLPKQGNLEDVFGASASGEGVSDADASAGVAPGHARVLPLDESKRRGRFVFRGVSLIAGAAAVVALLLGIQVNHLDSQVNHLQAIAAKPLYTQAVQAALEEPTTKRISLTPQGRSVAGVPTVTVAMTSSGQDYIISQKLSALPSSKTYQLWGQVNGKFVSLGLLGSKPTIIPFMVSPSTPVQLFAITAEPAGGVVQPTAAPVVQGVVNL